MNIFIVKKYTKYDGLMDIDCIFENLEDARNYIKKNNVIYKSAPYFTKDGRLVECYNNYQIHEYNVLPKQKELKKNWCFSYKVYRLDFVDFAKTQEIKFINEIKDDSKFFNADSAMIAADEVLKESRFQICSSQKWQKHFGEKGKEIYTINVFVTVDKTDNFFYQFQVYENDEE